MLETTPKDHTKKLPAFENNTVLSQLSYDLSETFKVSSDFKKQLKHISEKTGVHIKTLNRLINLENNPTPLTVFKIYKYIKINGAFSSDQIKNLAIVNVVAFLVALIAIKFFITMLKTYGFRVWGIYRVIVGIALLIMLYTGYLYA